jgi:hypothetical protein
MICGQWYIILYGDEGKTEVKRLGPFAYDEAQAKARKLEKTCQDWDKLV